MPALLLGKPHLTIFKDQRVILLDGDRVAVCLPSRGESLAYLGLVTQAPVICEHGYCPRASASKDGGNTNHR